MMAFLQPGRRGRFRSARVGRRKSGPLPYQPPTQAPQSLRRRLRWARECGIQDARSGALDAWSFPDLNLPFLAEVRAARNAELAQARMSAARAQSAHLVRRQRRVAVDAEDTRRRAEHAWRVEQADDDMRRAVGRMDELAQSAAAQRAERREARIYRRFVKGGVPTERAHEQASGDRFRSEAHAEARWEGRAPQVGRVFKIGLILALIAVEFPVEFLVLAYFHNMEDGRERILTLILAVSVSALTVLAPHLVGRELRRNQATGSARRAGITLCLVMLLAWTAIPAVFGWLRAKQILIAPTNEDGEVFKDSNGNPIASVADQLHVSPMTLIVAFIALLFISGAIGLLLGLAEEHPTQATYRDAHAERRRLGEVVDPDGSAALTVQELANEDAMQVAAQWQQEQDRIWETAQRLMATYLRTVAQHMADPKTTQAINALIALVEAERDTRTPVAP